MAATFSSENNIQSMRTPTSLRQRLINQFQSSENIMYLRKLFTEKIQCGPLRDFILENIEDMVWNYEQIEAHCSSDPIAQRGNASPAVGFWQEIRRINRAFFYDRMELLRDKRNLITGGDTRDGVFDSDEPYHYKMFEADSLYPPGYEHLNNGPLYAIKEDKTEVKAPRYGYGKAPCVASKHAKASLAMRNAGRVETFASSPLAEDLTEDNRYNGSTNNKIVLKSKNNNLISAREGFRSSYAQNVMKKQTPYYPSNAGIKYRERQKVTDKQNSFIEEDDLDYRGQPHRTPEQALAEYYGDNAVSSTTLGYTEQGGIVGEQITSQGECWKKNNGTEFNRYRQIPFWQNASRVQEGVDHNTLDMYEGGGNGIRETGGHVRRWDMSRVRHPRGEEYRRFGPRSVM